MSFDFSRADLVIQYALLLAGEEDEHFDRRLGPIHLIKYVYLADLAYAKRSGGALFTGAAWRFHNFGPWDASVFERVEPATAAIGAERLSFESNYGDDDWLRYRARDTQRLEEIRKNVPSAIALQLPWQVHTFLSDTPSLLNYVYKTKPMLNAAPEELLDFAAIEDIEHRVMLRRPSSEESLKPTPNEKFELRRSYLIAKEAKRRSESGPRMEQLSNKKRKRFKERLAEIRNVHRERQELVNPVKSPRYDEVYSQGVSWLEELGGTALPGDTDIVAEFSPDVWKSTARKGEDVS